MINKRKCAISQKEEGKSILARDVDPKQLKLKYTDGYNHQQT